MKLKQADVIYDMLMYQGYVNNVWAFHHNILRLSEVIRTLKSKGHKISGCYGKDLNNLSPKKQIAHRKVYYYFFDSNIQGIESNMTITKYTLKILTNV